MAASVRCSTNELRYRVYDGVLARAYKVLSGVSNGEALNCGGTDAGDNAGDLVARLLMMAKQLEVTGVSADDGTVDYASIARSTVFADYLRLAQALRSFDLQSLVTADDRKAFWINLYNALVIHAVIVHRPTGSIQAVRAVFDRAAYVIGGMRFSLSDIEHGILRANSGHPAFFQPQFPPGDPRRVLVLEPLDARLHFALNCAARSCPPIRSYDAKSLDWQLDLAARSFVNNGGVVIEKAKRTIYLSRIFSWYARDFGSALFGYRRAHMLVRFAVSYLDDGDMRQFAAEHTRDLRVRFLPYDWSLNG